ncbi:predicted protein [Postia placenta Mad-698-R]|uniref:Uncharacterized protein n=1 Tax=Postia placenta MAD-698-R-SB12 TaxID=670580 RepID=A0A1X6NAR1_9APHY|nr:hypothetical protein POSPLADRAFT_1065312 [Postia placenta MAD-698-R-SB12]EED81314.1 predicted protein [Postia placenta Mad-698-R]OSX65610.1 hypothetical protein POSPLADRAFT_1065312 [Postia placenta MAD-698-R-SB12]
MVTFFSHTRDGPFSRPGRRGVFDGGMRARGECREEILELKKGDMLASGMLKSSGLPTDLWETPLVASIAWRTSRGWGTDVQEEHYIPDSIAGRKVGRRALSEPGSGRNVTGMKLRAEKAGGGDGVGAKRALPALAGFSCPSQGCALCTRSWICQVMRDCAGAILCPSDRVAAAAVDAMQCLSGDGDVHPWCMLAACCDMVRMSTLVVQSGPLMGSSGTRACIAPAQARGRSGRCLSDASPSAVLRAREVAVAM